MHYNFTLPYESLIQEGGVRCGPKLFRLLQALHTHCREHDSPRPAHFCINTDRATCSIDVKVWRDALHKRIRMDTYEGSNSLIQTKGQDLEVTPRIDRLTCLKFQADEEDSILSAPVRSLPDLSLALQLSCLALFIGK